jgi:hypothetical protein
VGDCAASRRSVLFDREFDEGEAGADRGVCFAAEAIFAAVLEPVENVAEISVRFLPPLGMATTRRSLALNPRGGSIPGSKLATARFARPIVLDALVPPGRAKDRVRIAAFRDIAESARLKRL